LIYFVGLSDFNGAIGLFLKNNLASDSSAPSRTGAAFAAVHALAEIENEAQASKVVELLCKNASESTRRAIVDLFRLVDEIAPDMVWTRALHAIAGRNPPHNKPRHELWLTRLKLLLPQSL
jgi:hypothetical protein